MTDVLRNEERLLDLLLQEGLEGLDAAERLELNGLLLTHPDVNPDQFNEAIAQLDALPVGDVPPVPDGLFEGVQRRIEAEAGREEAAAQPPPRLGWWAAAAAVIVFEAWRQCGFESGA